MNVWGALGLTQACIPHLKKAAAEHGDASVVFIISMSMRNIRPLEGGYSSSKAAVQTAAKTMAVELGPTGVRVNCVAPGWIGGPNVETFIGWESESRGISRDDVRAEIEARIPLPHHPAAGRDREQRRLLRVAVVEGRHRPDPRRQRRRIPWRLTGDSSESSARVAVVTGASAGIGRAIAVALAGLGWTVAIGARRVALDGGDRASSSPTRAEPRWCTRSTSPIPIRSTRSAPT